MNENNVNEIKEILERYYNGESTEEEEMRLRRYFSSDDVADELLGEKSLFRQLGDASVPEVPEVPMGLEERLSGAIDSWEADERRAASNRKRLRPVRLRAIIGIAASFLLIMALGAVIIKHQEPQGLHAENDITPEEAYAQTEKALRIFANAINTGMDGVEKVDEASVKVRLQISNQLKQINSNQNNI